MERIACNSDLDCVPFGLLCGGYACVECLSAADCGNDEAMVWGCREGTCVAALPCENSLDCASTTQVCGVGGTGWPDDSKVCLDCMINYECPEGSNCDEGFCQEVCLLEGRVCDSTQGAFCGDCPTGEGCAFDGSHCRPACEDRSCGTGWDGATSCGSCPSGAGCTYLGTACLTRLWGGDTVFQFAKDDEAFYTWNFEGIERRPLTSGPNVLLDDPDGSELGFAVSGGSVFYFHGHPPVLKKVSTLGAVPPSQLLKVSANPFHTVLAATESMLAINFMEKGDYSWVESSTLIAYPTPDGPATTLIAAAENVRLNTAMDLDAEWIYVWAMIKGDRAIWRFPQVGGPPERLPPSGSLGMGCSGSDASSLVVVGDWVLFTSSGVLRRTSTTDPDCEAVLAGVDKVISKAPGLVYATGPSQTGKDDALLRISTADWSVEELLLVSDLGFSHRMETIDTVIDDGTGVWVGGGTADSNYNKIEPVWRYSAP